LFDGRPYAQVIAKLEYAWACGASDAEAAHFAEILPSNLCRFLQKRPDVLQRKMQLKNSPILKAKKCVVDAAETDPKIAIDYLERVTDDFTPKHKVEHSTPEDREFRIEVVDANDKNK